MTVTTTIYVFLLDEGTSVWRPVTACQVGPNLYRLDGAVPEGENWEFQPGQVVEVEERVFSDGVKGAAAVRPANPGTLRC